MRNIIRGGLILSIVAFAAPPAGAQNYSVGQKAPVFTLDRYGGGTVSNADYPGKVLFLNFFGST